MFQQHRRGKKPETQIQGRGRDAKKTIKKLREIYLAAEEYDSTEVEDEDGDGKGKRKA